MTNPATGSRIPSVLLLLALVLLPALAVPSAAFAAEPTIEVLQVGWDGLVVPGSWSPVRVRVTGGSTDLAGRVEVVTKARYQTGPQTTSVEYPTGAFGQEIALPAGVTKDVTLWVPSDPNYGGPVTPSGSIRLAAAGRTIAEERIEFRTTKTPYWPVIGVLADSPAVSRAIAQVELPVQGLPMPLSPARVTASDLPPSAERLKALSALVVQGNATATLTMEQRAAVHAWVLSGGHLVLTGGPDAARAASVLPSGTLPVRFSGTEGSGDLSALQRWAEVAAPALSSGPAARVEIDGGAVLAGEAGRPLAWRIGVGQGTLTVLAADPGLEPLVSWPRTPALLKKALEPAIPTTGDMNDKMRYVQMQQQDVAVRLQGAVEALPEEAFPGWQTVALILGGFLLVVGPLVHLVLWRVDRRVWSWVVIPAAALLLAGGMYYVGVGRGGRDVLVNVISHVRLDPSGAARQTVLAGFFAPTHSELSVSVPGDAAVRPQARPSFQQYGGPYGGPGMAPSTEPPYRIVAGRDTRVDFNAGQWGMRTVSLSRSLEGAGSLSARLGLEGGLVKGSVRNDTPYPLEDAVVLMGQGVARLEALAPGQTAQVVLDPGPPANPFGGRQPISWRILGKPLAGSTGPGVPAPAPVSAVSSRIGMAVPAAPYPRVYEQYQMPQDPESQRRLRLLDPIVNVPRAGPSAQAMPLTFLAFTRAPVGRDLPSTAGHPTFFLTLLEQPLSLDLPPGPFVMPAGLSPADLTSMAAGMGGGSNGTISWIQIQGGSLTYSFRPPVPAKARVEAIVLTTQQMGPSVAFVPGKGMGPPSPNTTPGPAEAGVFAIYRWQTASWEPLPGGTEQTRLEPAASYVGPGGEVKLQVTAAADKMVMFVQPELSVEGRVEP